MKRRLRKNSYFWIVTGFGTGVLFLIVTLAMAYFDLFTGSNRKETNLFLHKCKDCEAAKNEAIQDFRDNKARWFVTGGLQEDRQENEFPASFYNALETECHLRVVFTGCIGHQQFDCYNESIDQLVSESFGENRLEQVYNSLKKEKL